MAGFGFLLDENSAQGLPAPPPSGASAPGAFAAGVSNADDGDYPEQGVTLPWLISPALSYLSYNCWVEVFLDAGFALHRPLPRDNPEPDTLAAGFLGDDDFAGLEAGVNLKAGGKWADSVQRVANAEYTFALRGSALRVGYQVPIPGLKTVAGVPAVPAERQWATNRLVGNFSGIPVFHAMWDLWYFVTLPPKKAQSPPANLAQFVRGDVKAPGDVQLPYSQRDQNSVPSAPAAAGGAVQGSK